MKRILVLALIALAGCTEQQRARQFGGTATVELDPGAKLLNATWKQDDLWLLTRTMRPGEQPESYRFSESSAFGVVEGTVLIREQALTAGSSAGR